MGNSRASKARTKHLEGSAEHYALTLQGGPRTCIKATASISQRMSSCSSSQQRLSSHSYSHQKRPLSSSQLLRPMQQMQFSSSSGTSLRSSSGSWKCCVPPLLDKLRTLRPLELRLLHSLLSHVLACSERQKIAQPATLCSSCPPDELSDHTCVPRPHWQGGVAWEYFRLGRSTLPSH